MEWTKIQNNGILYIMNGLPSSHQVYIPQISCIVPVYNVEKYLSQCINSILAQTFTNFELILIDDGSTDNSGTICDSYSKKDSRVKVIHQKNAGVGAARNAGIDASCGEYICFVDSDDWVDEDYLKAMYDVAQNTGADMVVCGYRSEVLENSLVEDSKKIIKEYSFTPDGKNKIFCERKEFLEKFPKMRASEKINGAAFNAPWMRLIRISSENPMPKFNEMLSCGEDCLFNLELYKKIDSICYIKPVLYNYRYISSSLSHIFSEKRIKDEFFMLDETESFFREFCSKKAIRFFYKFSNSYFSWHIVALLVHYSKMEKSKTLFWLDAIRKKICLKRICASLFDVRQSFLLILIKLHFYKIAKAFVNIYTLINKIVYTIVKNTRSVYSGGGG